jgi:hypothetical protein
MDAGSFAAEAAAWPPRIANNAPTASATKREQPHKRKHPHRAEASRLPGPDNDMIIPPRPEFRHELSGACEYTRRFFEARRF